MLTIWRMVKAIESVTLCYQMFKTVPSLIFE